MNIFNTKKSDTLQAIVNAYAQRLGAKRAPSVRIIPGAECNYLAFLHRIHIGEQVLLRASEETCRAVIAHEVGHSQQANLHRVRQDLMLLLFALVMCAVLPIVGWLLHLTANVWWVISSSIAPWIPLAYLKYRNRTQPDESRLELEYDADDCSGRLVGYLNAYNGLIEYSDLFAGGRQSPTMLKRLEKLQPFALREANAE